MTELRALPADCVRLHADEWSEPFWDALSHGCLVVARCTGCGSVRMPPMPRCSACGSRGVSWADAAATGSVYSFTVVHRPVLAELADHVPYAVVLVTLDEPEVRMVGNLVGAEEGELKIGARVRAVLDPSRFGPRLVFELDPEGGGK